MTRARISTWTADLSQLGSATDLDCGLLVCTLRSITIFISEICEHECLLTILGTSSFPNLEKMGGKLLGSYHGNDMACKKWAGLQRYASSHLLASLSVGTAIQRCHVIQTGNSWTVMLPIQELQTRFRELRQSNTDDTAIFGFCAVARRGEPELLCFSVPASSWQSTDCPSVPREPILSVLHRFKTYAEPPNTLTLSMAQFLSQYNPHQ